MSKIVSYRAGKKIAFTNRKGGVGKTTMCINLAAELALRGYNIGLVDTDSQGHTAVALGMEKEDNLFKAIVGNPVSTSTGTIEYQPVPLDQLVRMVPGDSWYAPLIDINGNETFLSGDDPLPIGNLYLLPGGAGTYKIPTVTDDPFIFDDLLNNFIEQYSLDFIFIDTAPTMSLFDGAIYLSTDAFVYITEVEALSLDGVNDSIKQIKTMSKRRERAGLEPSRLLGVIPNKKRALREHNTGMQELGEAFNGLVWPFVRLLKNYTSAGRRGQTIRAFNPVGDEAKEILSVVNSMEQSLYNWLVAIN